MSTTALLVDILLIGIQVLIWITGLVFSFLFPPQSIVTLSEKSPTIFLFLLIALSYTLGIIFDYIIANFFQLLKSKEEQKVYRDGLVISILAHDKEIQKFLDNQYARLRIVRATVFNLPLITIATCCYILTNPIDSKLTLCSMILLILLIGTILTTAAFCSWKSRNKVYWGYISETLKIIDSKKIE
jgi:hypothetical protein